MISLRNLAFSPAAAVVPGKVLKMKKIQRLHPVLVALVLDLRDDLSGQLTAVNGFGTQTLSPSFLNFINVIGVRIHRQQSKN